jgi:hypothetical protein
MWHIPFDRVDGWKFQTEMQNTGAFKNTTLICLHCIAFFSTRSIFLTFANPFYSILAEQYIPAGP